MIGMASVRSRVAVLPLPSSTGSWGDISGNERVAAAEREAWRERDDWIVATTVHRRLVSGLVLRSLVLRSLTGGLILRSLVLRSLTWLTTAIVAWIVKRARWLCRWLRTAIVVAVTSTVGVAIDLNNITANDNEIIVGLTRRDLVVVGIMGN